MMIRYLSLFVVLWLFGDICVAQPGNADWHLKTATPQNLPEESLIIVSGDRRHAFQVEVARTSDERQIGMMFEDHLDLDKGMLFDNGRPQMSSFWMRNTYISLDIIFVRKDGTIARIEQEAEPLSLDRIPAGEPVLGVLELAGGRAAALGIQPGDTVLHPLFSSDPEA